MSVYYLSWNLIDSSVESVERYCPHCGKVVNFEDSLKRRQNANGKDIYEYAIFKCEKDHTWNKKLRNIKASSGLENNPMECAGAVEENQEIHVEQLRSEGIHSIHILIERVENRWRVDATLASKLVGVSRSQIQKLIKQGAIQVNSLNVSPKYFLRAGDTITIEITN